MAEMGKMEMELKVDRGYRPCYVLLNNGTKKKGMFHEWTINNGCVALIEDVHGKMHLVQPWRVQFNDDAGFDMYAWEDDIPDMSYEDSDDVVEEIMGIVNGDH